MSIVFRHKHKRCSCLSIHIIICAFNQNFTEHTFIRRTITKTSWWNGQVHFPVFGITFCLCGQWHIGLNRWCRK